MGRRTINRGGSEKMSNILLLGAGFSRNWGGWLASEVRSDLAMRIEGQDRFLDDLVDRMPDFELSLAQIQYDCIVNPTSAVAVNRLRLFQSAIASTFAEMNNTLAKRNFEFCNDAIYSISSYLTKFDAIFSLNQDLLMERHYLRPNNILTRSQGKVPGGLMPGLEMIPTPHYHDDDLPLHLTWRPTSEPFALATDHQPYFKLHGSTNWLSADGRQLMGMGGNKLPTIKMYPILDWYTKIFLEKLSTPNARLTVIGYGFRDQHVNAMIADAWEKNQFPMMVIGPEGRNILRKTNPSYGGAIPGPSGPLELIRSQDSTRPLSETFGGRDPAEHGKLLRFLR